VPPRPGSATPSSRTPTTVRAHEHRRADQAAERELPLRLVDEDGELKSEQHEEGRVGREVEHAPERDGAQPRVGLEGVVGEPAEVEPGYHRRQDAGDVGLLGGDVGAVSEQHREEDGERRVVQVPQDADFQRAGDDADHDAAGGGQEELEDRVRRGERAADRGGHRHPVDDQGGRVVDDRLALREELHPRGGADPAERRGRRERVGGRDDRAEDERRLPAQPGNDGVRHQGHHRPEQQHEEELEVVQGAPTLRSAP